MDDRAYQPWSRRRASSILSHASVIRPLDLLWRWLINLEVIVEEQQFQRLAERARTDPAFFHDLVYDPQKALAQMPDLPRETQARILAINPDEVIEGVTGVLRICGITCGEDSCERTCGMRSCGVTCASSCSGSTCGGKSCGQTTFVAPA